MTEQPDAQASRMEKNYRLINLRNGRDDEAMPSDAEVPLHRDLSAPGRWNNVAAIFK
jgi:hypothetical protein